jgi:putative phosphoesterase
MTKIGLLSDTHGHLDARVFKHFAEVDEIWHAGDIGTLDVLDDLRKFKPTRAVFGNIDGASLRLETKEFEIFQVEGKKVLITHIAGKPGRYNQKASAKIFAEKPDIVVCGHSHICLVQFDKNIKALWMNPGACGIKGFHKVMTLLRFEIDGDKVQNLEVVEWER